MIQRTELMSPVNDTCRVFAYCLATAAGRVRNCLRLSRLSGLSFPPYLSMINSMNKCIITVPASPARAIYGRCRHLQRRVTKTSAIPPTAGRRPFSKADQPQTDSEVEEKRQIPYREAVGTYMWAATKTRRGLSFAAHQLAMFSDDPGPTHWKTTRKTLQYMWRTRNIGITSGGEPEGSAKLSAWVDADPGTCPDTRRSILGGAAMMGRGSVRFSRVQKVTTAASSESEYVALAEMVNELRFLQQAKEIFLSQSKRASRFMRTTKK